METYKRICIKDWGLTALNGDHFEVKRGEEYITSANYADNTCTVCSNFWVEVPSECFAGEVRFT